MSIPALSINPNSVYGTFHVDSGEINNVLLFNNRVTNGQITMFDSTIRGLSLPVQGSDAANKDYVDSFNNSDKWKQPCRVASTANIPSLSGLLVIDGVALAVGDRILVQVQTNAVENGVYVVAVGAWSRSVDMAVGNSVGSDVLVINQGVMFKDSIFICTNAFGSDIVGTDLLAFTTGAVTVPGGPNTAVQFNNAGVFGGSGDFTWDGSTVDITGDVVVSGTVTATSLLAVSDISMKTNITPIYGSLGKIMDIDAIQYNFKNDPDRALHYGVSAQELEDVGLEHVVIRKGDKIGVSYNDLVALLIGSIQELKREINELKTI